jgi:uncharacterized protein YegP (UPF0339 family)
MRLIVEPSRDGQWFVVAVARNGQKVAVTETYTRKTSAVRAAKRIIAALAKATIEVR